MSVWKEEEKEEEEENKKMMMNNVSPFQSSCTNSILHVGTSCGISSLCTS